MQRIAVIGLGRFGLRLARLLGESGAQVLAIDRSGPLVEEIKDDVDVAVRLDATDQAALAAQELDQVDVCVVAIGENFEAALLAAMVAKNLEVPRIICRAQTQLHADIFRSIGMQEVIQPEAEAGEHLARKLTHPHLEDYLRLGEGHSLIELHTPKEFAGVTLKQLDLRRKYGVNLVAIKRAETVQKDGETIEQQRVFSVPKPEDLITEGDILVLIGSDDALARLPKE